ncbi:glutathione peroxidase [Labilibaculum manganireducens]|uniref:Glutathione peroxidase n=1 Tax=Labilibaculum manganireducens TaxID=1940525 RepID=A0A2N3I129_9BACT|nr:glutathione peroxidase [Labilibaculum manganireducens]PKQ64018.1 glutathione peroxidase [Labilibaculum manganireducens]
MRKIITICILLISTSFMSFSQESIYQFTVTSIDGSEFNFADLKGKKIMIVNTASKCGFTPQYELLEALYKEYQDKDFVIVGFPANNFLWQEPGTDEEIKEFCTKNYGVSFPMMSKISVKGSDIHPIYSWLTQKSKNGVMDSKVKWNFQKYLIDENGKLIDVLSPKEKPNCEKVISWLEQ